MAVLIAETAKQVSWWSEALVERGIFSGAAGAVYFELRDVRCCDKGSWYYFSYVVFNSG